LLDVCHLDEFGIAMTLPTGYSWSPVGHPVCVPYEANQGRRLHGLGAYFSDGPEAGHLAYELYRGLPKSRAKKTKGQIISLPASVLPEEVGPITADRLVAFVWKIAGRPAVYLDGWKRVRPLYVWMDNYSVHVGQVLKEAIPALEAANIYLRYLPGYCPELSEIEPIWQDVKYREMSERSFDDVVLLREATRAALERKASKLKAARQKITNLLREAA
jgi:transposase